MPPTDQITTRRRALLDDICSSKVEPRFAPVQIAAAEAIDVNADRKMVPSGSWQARQAIDFIVSKLRGTLRRSGLRLRAETHDAVPN
ncbi:hypothetical protein [Bradyrhizobium sp. AZCC 1721]|uniref:hypothetical protein n=1 Tax=Bradyrhizobium sp. AZCC 1721 TaxID=3117016 RepID=UPI002FF37ABF